jgi:hypothetical protein
MDVKMKIISYSLVGVIGVALLVNILPQRSEAVDSNQKISLVKRGKSPNDLPSNIIFSKETDLPVVSSEGLFITKFDDLKTMYSAADIVAEIKVKDQNVVPQEEWDAYTTSNVEVIKTYKGDTTITNLLIVETGGPVDMTGFKEKYKDKPGDGIQRDNPNVVESTLEGVPVMKKGNSYLVFLQKSPQIEGMEVPEALKNGYYTVQGSIQGKIKLDKGINKAVATVDPEIINEDIHFFQKMFAGKDIATLENEIQKLKEK